MFSSNINEFELKCSNNMINYTTIYRGKGNNTHKLQVFDIKPVWCKYVSFQMISFYGREKYCTITQIKVIGISPLGAHPIITSLPLLIQSINIFLGSILLFFKKFKL